MRGGFCVSRGPSFMLAPKNGAKNNGSGLSESRKQTQSISVAK